LALLSAAWFVVWLFVNQPERLSVDLAIYSMGIFPLFQHAATQVKPAILSFYEQYYLPLGTSLGPCLSGLIMSILPGLEEESSEFYERCLKLLDYMAKKATRPLFFRALWKTYVRPEQVYAHS
jgi:hypothetical protein